MTMNPPKPLSFGTGCLWFVLFAVVSAGVSRCVVNLGAPESASGGVATGALIALIGGAIAYRIRRQRQWKAAEQAAFEARFARLSEMWGPEVAARIIAGQFWQGQTFTQLIEALGNPVDMDEEVLKSKTKHTAKYYPQGAGRFGLKIMLEDGVVVGWKR